MHGDAPTLQSSSSGISQGIGLEMPGHASDEQNDTCSITGALSAETGKSTLFVGFLLLTIDSVCLACSCFFLLVVLVPRLPFFF